MIEISYFIIVQAVAVALLILTVFISSCQYLKYNRIKRLYKADYAKRSYLKSISSILPFMPRYKGKRYKAAEELIMESGLRISVEELYLLKSFLFILGLVFFISIQTTNAFMLYRGIIGDLNMDKSLIEGTVRADTETIRLEKDMFDYIYSSFPREKATLRELLDKGNIQIHTEYIEAQLRDKWEYIKEDTKTAAERMYKKLLRIRALETDYFIYLRALLAAVFLYSVPNIAAYLKIKLIEDKRDWEILNFVYVFSIFGRLPPFNIRNVLASVLVISDIYRPMISEALNGVKSGKGEAAFDGLLHRVEKEELFEIFEVMRLSMSTGLLNIVDNIDEMAANQLKWLEIKSIKRRKTKQVIAMVPVVLVMLAAVVYFSYSLSTLSNPMNFIK